VFVGIQNNKSSFIKRYFGLWTLKIFAYQKFSEII
jgi:hypothetical protein